MDRDRPGAGGEATDPRSQVTVRELVALPELYEMKALFDDIWDPGEAGSLVRVELLRAMSHGGNYLAGAYDPAGALVGASLAFFTAPPGRGLHSHITGVAASARRRSVGLALKLHQRRWALANGLTEITWTFDPLVRRNAYFNLVKLGARAREYLVDFYGDIPDAVNRGQGSDRLLAVWDLADQPPASPPEPPPSDPAAGAGAAPLLTVSPAGEPVPATASPASGRASVQVPADIEAMRRADPDLTRRWRQAVRDTLGARLAGGARVAGFTRAGHYIVEGGGS